MKEPELNDELMCMLIIESIDHTIILENKVLLDLWRKADPEHEEVYQGYIDVQVNLDEINNRNRYDTQSSWESLEKKLLVKRKAVFPWYSVAAAVLLLLSVGYYFVDLNNKYVLIDTKNNTLTSVSLPDGTLVNMNRATTIRYNKDDFMTNRKIELINGEMFIQVIKHDGPQLVVNMGEVDALDIGTKFNVSRSNKEVSITVAEGIVALRKSKSNQQVLLRKGQVGRYTIITDQLTLANNYNSNYKAWVDKKFSFEEVPLKEVAEQLGKVYQTTITVNGDRLKIRRLTAQLQYQNIDSAMAVISASLQCKVTKYKDTYVLSDL